MSVDNLNELIADPSRYGLNTYGIELAEEVRALRAERDALRLAYDAKDAVAVAIEIERDALTAQQAELLNRVAELATLKSYREADVFLFRHKIARLESELAKAWEAGAQAQRERMAFAAQAWWSDIDGFPTGTELGDMLRGVPLVSCPK
jgi:chromosome segregation ATPase